MTWRCVGYAAAIIRMRGNESLDLDGAMPSHEVVMGRLAVVSVMAM